MSYQNKMAVWLLAMIVMITTIGCSAVHTSIKKRNLDVQTKMSDSIFLDPVSPAKHTIYVQVRITFSKRTFCSVVRVISVQRMGCLVQDMVGQLPVLQVHMLRAEVGVKQRVLGW